MIEQERQRINAELGACFKKGSSKAEAAISDVVQRNGDWKSVFERCNEITGIMNSVDRSKLLKKVNECNGYLEIILKMAREGRVGKVASSAVMNLADGAYQVACELEFYAVAYYKAEVFVSCVNQTLEHFKKVTRTDGK
jgi:hypothetical protein